jgi:hypothetical protein
MKNLVALIYPFTKAKLRRALNFTGTLLAAAAVVAVWLSSIDAGEKIGATIVLVTTFLTRAKGAIQKLEAGVDSLPIPADDEPTKPFPQPRSNTPIVALLALGTALLLAGPARAEAPQALGCLDTANTYCVVPAAAVGWQINLKTGGAANAVSLVGLTLQHTFGSLPVGLGLYVGAGMSKENQGSYQGCFGASVTNWGLFCIGPQRASFAGGETALQWMATLAPQLTFGGTPAYVREQTNKERN